MPISKLYLHKTFLRQERKMFRLSIKEDLMPNKQGFVASDEALSRWIPLPSSGNYKLWQFSILSEDSSVIISVGILHSFKRSDESSVNMGWY